jgi:hypothetical protein
MYLCSCSSEPCFPKSKGNEYRINVIEVWDENSQFSGGQHNDGPCPKNLDIVEGGSFTVAIKGFNSDSLDCECGKGTAKAPGNWSWKNLGEERACHVNFLQARLYATSDTCNGFVELSINSGKVPSGTSVTNNAPRATLSRSFTWKYDPDTPEGTCPGICVDTYAVEIEEL